MIRRHAGWDPGKTLIELDDVIKACPHVTYAEESVVDLDGEHEAACCGWSNPTPWNSPRECSEEDLMVKLEKLASQVKRVDRSLFCLHCPPFESQIDQAPLLDKTLKPHMEAGRPVIIPVGSKSVRDQTLDRLAEQLAKRARPS